MHTHHFLSLSYSCKCKISCLSYHKNSSCFAPSLVLTLYKHITLYKHMLCWLESCHKYSVIVHEICNRFPIYEKCHTIQLVYSLISEFQHLIKVTQKINHSSFQDCIEQYQLLLHHTNPFMCCVQIKWKLYYQGLTLQISLQTCSSHQLLLMCHSSHISKRQSFLLHLINYNTSLYFSLTSLFPLYRLFALLPPVT